MFLHASRSHLMLILEVLNVLWFKCCLHVNKFNMVGILEIQGKHNCDGLSTIKTNLLFVQNSKHSPFFLSHTCKPTQTLPPKHRYNLSFYSITLEVMPVYTEDLILDRRPWRFRDKFEVIHTNMCLSTKRAKATISKTGIFQCIYLAASSKDYCTQGHFRIMSLKVT